MKKLLVLVVCCLCLTGCDNNIKIGDDLKIVNENDIYQIEGSFSNKKKNCSIYEVEFKLSNGDIQYNYNHKFPVLVDNDVYEFSISINDDKLNNISNLNNYKVKINKIKCSD